MKNFKILLFFLVIATTFGHVQASDAIKRSRSQDSTDSEPEEKIVHLTKNQIQAIRQDFHKRYSAVINAFEAAHNGKLFRTVRYIQPNVHGNFLAYLKLNTFNAQLELNQTYSSSDIKNLAPQVEELDFRKCNL